MWFEQQSQTLITLPTFHVNNYISQLASALKYRPWSTGPDRLVKFIKNSSQLAIPPMMKNSTNYQDKTIKPSLSRKYLVIPIQIKSLNLLRSKFLKTLASQLTCNGNITPTSGQLYLWQLAWLKNEFFLSKSWCLKPPVLFCPSVSLRCRNLGKTTDVTFMFYLVLASQLLNEQQQLCQT